MSLSPSQRRTLCFCAALAAAILAAYANHFVNGFHFDDFHTVTGNPYIRDLRNVPRFFADGALFSTLPDHASYRPVTSTSLAVDHWLGRGYVPFYFHLSTFVWFLVQVTLMFFLFRRIFDLADPHPSNSWTAFLAAACYGLHPANAETVNYIVQRADLYCALGIVASLLWFSACPRQRRLGWYLLPALAACLSKAPALVYPLILLAYVLLFERHRPVRKTRAAFATGIGASLLLWKMTPASFQPGAASPSLYRLTQPWVALHYFKSFFLPTELTADTDWTCVTGPLTAHAIAGYLFVAALLAAAYCAARRQQARPIAFGLLWFVLALLPTSLMPLAEVTNDHRMFFPFVGLALAVFWSLRLLVTARPRLARAALAALLPVLATAAIGTHARNIVWRSEESLWRDATLKSPGNGRGLMNYGLTFQLRGDYVTALAYFERALVYCPNYWPLEVNLGISNGGLGRDRAAERHFQRALLLAPNLDDPYFYYARWLLGLSRQYYQAGRYLDSIAAARQALLLRPDNAEADNDITAASLAWVVSQNRPRSR